MRHRETGGKTRPTLLNYLTSHGHMIGVSTDIVNTGTLPTLTFGPYGCDTWPITKIHWDNQSSRGSKSLQILLRRAQINAKYASE